MPLWSNKDVASNSDIAATMQVNKATTTANQSLLYGNTKPGTFFANQAIGQFAVDTNEVQANKAIPHSGWVLRKEGTGLRAGRVEYEVLVATGSISTDASDDTNLPDYVITIRTQPQSNSAQTNTAVAFAVVAEIAPSSTFTYKWQRDGGPSSQTWVDITNVAPFSGNANATLQIANNSLLDGNVFRVVLTKTGANTVYSSNASLTVLP
jgi:hypothetical protein